jgi:hypothetical protein
MANESTYAGISSLVASVYELAMFTAQEGNVVAPFVKQFNDQEGANPRIFGAYSGGTFLAVAESADSTQQAFNATAGGTLTPSVYAQMALLTNRRIKTDPANAVSDAGEFLGQTASAFIDTSLVGLFSSLTGGTVFGGGTANVGGTLSWQNILRAQAYLRMNKVMGEYAVVLTPVQWYYLTSASSGAPQFLINNGLAESIVGGFYQASFGGMNFFVDANITAGTASIGAMFSPPAIALDIRQGFQIEPQYNASYSGNGAWELNASFEIAYGVYRPTYGVQLMGTSL